MSVLSRQQLYTYAYAAGFTGAAADEVVAIALAESGGDTQHVNVNGASVTNGQNVPAGTKDRGVLQINDWWNPSVSDGCAFDPTCSFQWAFKVTQGGQPGLFHAYWVTVQNGAYQKYLQPNSGGQATGQPSGSTGSQGDACLACGPVGSAAYQQCLASIAVGFVPDCANAGYQQSQQNLQNQIAQIGTVVPALSQFLQNMQSLQAALPGALVRIGLFLIVLVLVAGGLLLIANSTEEPKPT